MTFRTIISVSAVSILLLCPAGSVRAADWPQWRGPERDGVSKETGLLKEWPKEGPPLAWKATGIGEGMGAAAVAGGRIYTTGDNGDAAWLFTLNEADGNRHTSCRQAAASGRHWQAAVTLVTVVTVQTPSPLTVNPRWRLGASSCDHRNDDRVPAA